MLSSPVDIVGLLQEQARLNPASPAIVASHRAPLSYEELLQEIDSVVRVLIAADVRPNDRVAIIGSGGPEMVVLFLAVASIAACAPLNPAYTAAELEFYLQDLHPRLLIIESGLSTPAPEVARQLRIPTLEIMPAGTSAGKVCFAGTPKQAASASFASTDDTALVLHTSGTTGRPKMVPLTQRNLCRSALNIARSLALTPADRCLSVMPLFHIHGLIGGALATLISGGSVACVGGFRLPAFAGWLEALQPTWYTAAPSIHTAVLSRAPQLREIALSHRLRFIRSCSAPLPPHVIQGLEALFDVPVVEAYGMTEAAHQIACNPLPPTARKPGSVGIATGTAIAIMDKTGALLPSGAEGEIVIRGEGVMAGYVAAAESNMAAFSDGWFRTGDQGRIDADDYLFITGRIKEIINRGGEKISPREIDEVLLSHPSVSEAVAFALPDARLGEDVGAAIVLKPDAGDVDARSILTFAEARLAPFKLPRRILFVSEIPRGPTGKPQRVGLAKRLGLELNSVAASASDAVPSTSTEVTLSRLCRDAFHLETIGIHDDLFDSGADSLSAMRLLREIECHWNIMLTIADMLSAPTIASFARLIDEIEPNREVPRLAVVQAGGTAPPFFCVAAGPGFRELARLLGPEQPFLGSVHPDAIDLPRPCRIEDAAARHVEIIRSVQPHGPYFIGGWCVDGLVAYEVAQQLRHLGERVALLVLFDTSFCPSRFEEVYGHLRAGAETIVKGSQIVVQPQRWHEIPSDLVARVHKLGLGEKLRSHLRSQPSEKLQEAGGWKDVAALLSPAARRYRPLPYEGRVLLLNRSSEQSRWTRSRQNWARVIRGRIEAFDIPGGHVEMFERPQVVHTAEKLGAALRDCMID